MVSKIASIIEDELKHPDKYTPIARGPWVALCIMLVLASLVPFWAVYLFFKTYLSHNEDRR